MRPSDTEARRPEITAVIVVGNHRQRGLRAIESVRTQRFGGRLEILIMDMADRAIHEPFTFDDVRVQQIAVPPEAAFGQARATAVRAARGPVVVFLEEHCLAMPGWVEALVRAHQGPWSAVGAEVHNANPGVGWSDALYLMGYSAWMPPAVRGEASLSATHNTSYKRDSLLEFADRLPDLLTAEPLLQEELLKRGHRLFVEPEARFSHENETTLRSSSVLYLWNRSLGRIRAREAGWSRLRRYAYLASVPIVPWRRLARLIVYFLRNRRRHLGSLIRQMPRIWILDLLAAAGLAVGAIVGSPADDMRFTQLELRGERPER